MSTRDASIVQSHRFAKLLGITLSWGLLMTLICITLALTPAQSSGQGNQTDGSLRHPPLLDNSGDVFLQSLSPKQKQSIMRANFAKSKSDAAELAALAKGLREVLNRPRANLLPIEVINRADKIEKLARKIRDETKGY
jgi:hypothetical protein